ncbi:MAG: aldehyde dehydrogenase family protein [Deltaproteobacteria bacterium]|nr:aldehyde dehydrogenase family protein [Deltaproteobacteria bacterium]MBW2070291.1 aldehyde dehydrogenase family protein [Deltaproteobacteria bacterium]
MPPRVSRQDQQRGKIAMEEIDRRLEQVHRLMKVLQAKREDLISIAIKDTGFTRRECNMEVDTVLSRLRGFDDMADVFADRQPLCGPEEEVALVLPYNGSAWLNTAIVSIYLVGNRLRVKFASRDSEIARFTESLYQPIFGDVIQFDYAEGRTFLQRAITAPNIPAICLFGSDVHAWQYLQQVKSYGKKFVFEGPGKDPFIVLAGADLDAAARELALSKYLYAGQTCTAPERVYLEQSIHDEFLEMFLHYSRTIKLGDPADPATQMGPVASERAITAIKAQLQDAVARGARIALGGKIEGNLVYPTVVVGATQEMLGMQEETFGPVSFISSFDTVEQALQLARDNRYGLRAAVYGGGEARPLADELVGEPYCHPVEEITFGLFGTVAVNQPRSESWVGAFVSKAVGGYGLSGWIWETASGEFILKQGPKLLSLETSEAVK